MLGGRMKMRAPCTREEGSDIRLKRDDFNAYGPFVLALIGWALVIAAIISRVIG